LSGTYASGVPPFCFLSQSTPDALVVRLRFNDRTTSATHCSYFKQCLCVASSPPFPPALPTALPPALPPALTPQYLPPSSSSAATLPPAAPGTSWKTVVTASFTLAGAVESFNKTAFVRLLTSRFPKAGQIVVAVSSGSVLAEVTFVMEAASDAEAVVTALASVDPSDMSSSWFDGAFDVTAVSVPTISTQQASIPRPPIRSSQPPTGMVVGIALISIASVAGCVALVAIAVCMYRRNQKKQQLASVAIAGGGVTMSTTDVVALDVRGAVEMSPGPAVVMGEVMVQERDNAVGDAGGKSVADELASLYNMKQQGILSEERFSAAKAKVLAAKTSQI